MSKTWKWILGILLGLVLIAVLFSIGFMWQSRYVTGWNMPFERGWDSSWNSPMQRQWDPQVPGQWVHPMMMDRRGFSPFGGFFLLGGLLKWVLFFGLLYGAYWLGRRNARLAIDPAPAAPSIEPATPAVEPEPAPRKRAKKVE